MQPSFRSQETLTLPSSLTGYGDFGHRLNSEFISSCGAENETAVDLAITITVERVARYFQDSGREAVTSDGLCPSGGPGPRTPSWFSSVVARTIYDQYTVVRFDTEHGSVTLRDLDQVAKSLSNIVHIMQLNNGRWEILVWKGCITKLKGKLYREYPGSFLEVDQNPWDPDPEDVKYFGPVRARKLCPEWFRGRALRAIQGDRYTVGPYSGYILYCVLPHIGERKEGTASPRSRL
ncbi:hypothetical protein LTR67_006371 [Exophiala xenobiotica]